MSKPKEPEAPSKTLKVKTDLSTGSKDENKPIEAKIVLLGDQNVGKSSIAQRFCKNVFTGAYVVTIGGAYLQQKLVLSNGAVIKFHIWDTGGQERFRSMANLYYQDAAAAILFSAENATKLALDAIQIYGGMGYINETPTGRFLRDAKLYEIGAGTSEIRRMLIGRQLFIGGRSY